MPRPRSRSAADPPGLFDVPTPGRRRGRHARALDDAVRAARGAGRLTATDGALVSLLRALARALDHAETTDQVYAVAQLAREYRATLADAGLVPAPGPPADPFAALLDDLADDDVPRGA
jgi:hypothetical protein